MDFSSAVERPFRLFHSRNCSNDEGNPTRRLDGCNGEGLRRRHDRPTVNIFRQGVQFGLAGRLPGPTRNGVWSKTALLWQAHLGTFLELQLLDDPKAGDWVQITNYC